MQHFGHVIQSQAIRVEVYKAPRIHPHEIFLLPGASYVVCSKVQVLFLQYLFNLKMCTSKESHTTLFSSVHVLFF